MKQMRDSQKRALMSLLADGDEHMLELLREKFQMMGSEGINVLQDIAADFDHPAQAGASRILRTLREREAELAFATFCHQTDRDLDLETGCWKLALTRYPELDLPAYLHRLNEMSRELSTRLPSARSGEETIHSCNTFLFEELGFAGDTDDYYNPDNSYLNRVLDRRRGIPVTLSVMYLLVGEKLNLPLRGVNMPGHFLLMWDTPEEKVYFDPFNGGTLLSLEECRTVCERLGHTFTPEYLVPATPRQILLRICRNLRVIYTRADMERAERIQDFIAALIQSAG